MDQSGVWVLVPNYDSIGQIESDGRRVATLTNGNKGLFDSSAREWRLSPVYEEIMGVESDGNRRVKRGKWGLFDSTNDVWYLEIIYDGDHKNACRQKWTQEWGCDGTNKMGY